MGPAMTIWLTGDPSGVRNAARMKMMRNAYLKFRIMKPAVTSPIFARNSTIVGIWKMTANASTIFSQSENVVSTRGSNLIIGLVAIFFSTSQIIGNAMSCPNQAPTTREIDESAMNGIASFFSWEYRPGAMNSHTCSMMSGEAMSSPAMTASFTYSENASAGSMAVSGPDRAVIGPITNSVMPSVNAGIVQLPTSNGPNV